MAVVVNPIKRFAGRALAHVFQKRNVTIQPSVANPNAATAVFGVFLVRGAKAPLPHPLPGHIGRIWRSASAPRMSVCAQASIFDGGASLAPSDAPIKLACEIGFLCSAAASREPVPPPSISSVSKPDHDKKTERLAGQIWKISHV